MGLFVFAVVAAVVVLGLHFAGHQRAALLWHARCGAVIAIVFSLSATGDAFAGSWGSAAVNLACVAWLGWMSSASYRDVREMDGAP